MGFGTKLGGVFGNLLVGQAPPAGLGFGPNTASWSRTFREPALAISLTFHPPPVNLNGLVWRLAGIDIRTRRDSTDDEGNYPPGSNGFPGAFEVSATMLRWEDPIFNPQTAVETVVWNLPMPKGVDPGRPERLYSFDVGNQINASFGQEDPGGLYQPWDGVFRVGLGWNIVELDNLRLTIRYRSFLGQGG